MRKLATRYFLLNKRLFQKYSFLLVLCMVPVMMLAMKYIASQESGMMTIALSMEDSADETAGRILRGFAEKEDVLAYVICDTPEEAKDLVVRGKADCAWIFPENLRERLSEVAATGSTDSVVTVYERENSTVMNFTRELLSNSLYPDFSYLVYANYVRNQLGITGLTDAQLMETFERYQIKNELFEMGYLDGEEVEDTGYLLAPMRGMLAVWLVLCGFAAVLYFMQDLERGTFVWVPAKDAVNLAYGVQMIPVLDGAVVVAAACVLLGIKVSMLREIVSILLFSLCIIGFCNFLRLLLGKMEWLGAVLPVLVFAMILMNPVFLDLKIFGAARYFFPPIYYLKSIHNPVFLGWMAAYALGLYVLNQVMYRLSHRSN